MTWIGNDRMYQDLLTLSQMRGGEGGEAFACTAVALAQTRFAEPQRIVPSEPRPVLVGQALSRLGERLPWGSWCHRPPPAGKVQRRKALADRVTPRVVSMGSHGLSQSEIVAIR